MKELDELKLRLGIAPTDRTKDQLLDVLLGRALSWAKDFCRISGDGAELSGIVIDMAAHDYALLGAQGIEKRTLSGVSESYAPDYPEQIMMRLRMHRRLGVPV